MGDLVQIVYVSSAAAPMTANELRDLLIRAQRDNQKAELTGALLYSDGNFIQVLEGRAEEVERVFARICRDRRHHGVIRLFSRTIAARSFPDWAMGWISPDKSEAGRLPELREWRQMTENMREGHARTLLEVFCRQHIPAGSALRR
jgi:hypothetical protein